MIFSRVFFSAAGRLGLGVAALGFGACATQYRVVGVPEKELHAASARYGTPQQWGLQQEKLLAIQSRCTRPSVEYGVLNYSDRLGVPQLDARINGQWQRCVLDSGCAVPVAMDFFTAKAHGVKLFPMAKISLTAQGAASEQLKCAVGVVERFELPGIVDFKNMPTVILPRQYVYQRNVLGVPVTHGQIPLSLLGAGLFRGLSYMSFDCKARTLAFSSVKAYAPSAGAARIPLFWEGDQLYVWLEIGGQRFKVRLDTGSSGAVDLPGDVAVRGRRLLGVEPAMSLDRVSMIRERVVKEVRMGGGLGQPGVSLRSVKVAQSATSSGLLGYGLLKRYRFTLDFRHNVLWLEAPGATSRAK